MEIYLGLDAGLATVGFGVIQLKNRQSHYVNHGIFKTLPATPFAERLHQLKTDLFALLSRYQPAGVGMEELFFATNTKTALKVAHARGVLLEGVHSHHLTIVEMTPLQLKNNLCGDGRADKQQMQLMVKRLLHLPSLPQPDDAADALAMAIFAARVIAKGRAGS